MSRVYWPAWSLETCACCRLPPTCKVLDHYRFRNEMLTIHCASDVSEGYEEVPLVDLIAVFWGFRVWLTVVRRGQSWGSLRMWSVTISHDWVTQDLLNNVVNLTGVANMRLGAWRLVSYIISVELLIWSMELDLHTERISVQVDFRMKKDLQIMNRCLTLGLQVKKRTFSMINVVRWSGN